MQFAAGSDIEMKNYATPGLAWSGCEQLALENFRSSKVGAEFV